MIIEITQSKPQWHCENIDPRTTTSPPDFYFRGGATLIVDLEAGAIRYIIRKSIVDAERLERQREYRLQPHDHPAADPVDALRVTYFGRPGEYREPFAMLHRSAPRFRDEEDDE